MKRRTLLLAAPLGLLAPGAFAAAPMVEVWKDPNCGCCHDWVKHLDANGFATRVRDEGNTDDPSLRLVDAVQCRNFFARVIRHTGDALAIHLGVPRVSWTA